ncbi:MAG: hypothetical protein H0T42_32975 [Deltaproteobacteria bacterium]|nr:hypothetical protein [Deltaproteobacteria bacterium]
MTRALALVLFLVAVPAAADSKAKPAAPPQEVTKAAAKPTECKKVVVGRGLDRRVVCEIVVPVTVQTDAPRPNVIIVHQSPRAVVGRPKSENRLNGLSQRRN